jgi:hypothetical protein
MDNIVNRDEFEKVLLVNWTKFINPQRLISFVLSNVLDTDLQRVDQPAPTQKKSVQITLSQFRPAKNGSFLVWADFVIPKKEGLAVGTCELRLDPLTGSIEHSQTLGNIFAPG